jgi:hypothetical protein
MTTRSGTGFGCLFLCLAWLPGVPAQSAPAGAQAPTVLFAGQPDTRMVESASAGGDFARFARYADGALIVEAPDGAVWAKTGLWSTEPVVRPASGADSTLIYEFDAARTVSFVGGLGPGRQGDEWDDHLVRFGWSRDDAEDAIRLELFIRTVAGGQVWLPKDTHGRIALTLTAEGAVRLQAAGGPLLEGTLTQRPLPDLKVFAMAHAPGPNLATTLVLQRITLQSALHGPPDPRSEPSMQYLGGGPVTLFAGQFGDNWQPFSSDGGVFHRHGRIGPAGLTVEVPAGNGWGKVGIVSREPMVWLDGDALTRVSFTLSPETTGAALMLALPYAPASDPGHPSLRFYWLRAADGSGARVGFHVDPHATGDFWTADEPEPAPPTQIVMIFRAGSVALEIDGVERTRREWAFARPGIGLHLHAMSHAVEYNASVRLGLPLIDMERGRGRTPSDWMDRLFLRPIDLARAQAATESVALLGGRPLFAGTATPEWEGGQAAGGDFAAFARYADGMLLVEVPAQQSWGKTGLLSAEPVIVLDERAAIAPLRLEITVDPARTSGFIVSLSLHKDAEMWGRSTGWFSLVRREDGSAWTLGNSAGAGLERNRLVPADWMAHEWDGRLLIDFRPGIATASLPGGPQVANLSGVNPVHGTRHYLALLSHPPAENQPSRLALKSVRLGFALPHELPAIERFRFIPDTEFDPEEFLDRLARDLDVEQAR